MRHLVVPLALAALCLSGCQTSPDAPPVAVAVSASPTPSTTPAVAGAVSASPTPSATPSPTSTATPSAEIRPDLRTRSTCSVAAGKFPKMTKGVRFTAQSTVVNRGNIGATLRLKATWTGSAPVHRTQTTSVRYGKKVTVTFNSPTTASEATAFRANRDTRCDVTVKVLSYLGKPRPTR